MSDDSRAKRYPFFAASKVDATGAWQEKRRLAAAMRLVIDRMVRADASAEAWADAAENLELFAETLAGLPQRSLLDGYSESSVSGDVTALFDMSPIIGRSNPIAPPVECEVDGETVRGNVTFTSAYEGPPGHVHGGVVAAVFDELLGFVQSLTEQPGMTGTLNIKYRAPTPLHRELSLRARVTKVEGRKTFAVGEMFHGDVLCAEAEGLFISIDRSRFEGMLQKKAQDERNRDRDG